MDFISDHLVLFIIGVTLLVGAIAVVIIIILTRKRDKKQDVYEYNTFTENEPLHGTGFYAIRLANYFNSSQFWTFELNTQIFIGRDVMCQLRLNEMSVSRQQCVIFLNYCGKVILENISKSNITIVNGGKVYQPVELHEGDEIRCGTITLLVEAISDPDHDISMRKVSETEVVHPNQQNMY